jgi:hypothetical protein
VCAAAPAFSGWLAVKDFPSPIPCHLGCLCSLLHVFFVVIVYYSVFCLFFPWVGVGLSRELCWSGPGLSVEYCAPLSSSCGPCLPKLSGHRHLVVAQGPSWSPFNVSGDAMCRLEVWRSQSFASSGWFFL